MINEGQSETQLFIVIVFFSLKHDQFIIQKYLNG